MNPRTKYLRKDTGEVVGVHAGLAGWWVAGTVSDGGCLKRIKSKLLPSQRKPWAMQRLLDTYAKKKGWVPENPDGSFTIVPSKRSDGTIPSFRFYLECDEHGEVAADKAMNGLCLQCGRKLNLTSEYLGQVKAEEKIHGRDVSDGADAAGGDGDE